MSIEDSFDLVIAASEKEVKVIASDNRAVRQFFPKNWLQLFGEGKEKGPVAYKTSLDIRLKYEPFEATGPFITPVKKGGLFSSDENESFPLKSTVVLWKRTHPEMILKSSDRNLDQYIERSEGILDKKEEGVSTWLLLNDFVSFSASDITPVSFKEGDLARLIKETSELSL